MSHNKISLLLIFCLFSLGAKESCEYEKVRLDAECKSDKDCIEVNNGCCGCNQGGRKKAISLNKAHIKEDCHDVMCAQVISKDPTCKQKAVCEDGVCVLR